ncbi:hypothetical protein HY492_00925 [Candidatus Woesearchaeota archaeon]|nr:hypothetical protein [Candidatus Woesearchaeota archaeon]
MSIDPALDAARPPVNPAAVPNIPEEEPKNTILLWSVGIIIVLVAAIFLIRLFYAPELQRGELQTYGNWEFERVQGLWQTLWQIEGTQLILNFHYLPQETLNTSILVTPSWDPAAFDRNEVFIAFDPTKENQAYVQIAATELAFKLKSLGFNISTGYTRNASEEFPPRPVVGCSTPNASVIIVDDVNRTASLLFEKTCVLIQGNQDDLVRATDRFLYTFYSIIPNLQ